MDSIRKELRDIRRDFEYGTLDPSEVPSDPIQLLKSWLNDAIKLEIKDANAFVLSTAIENQPDSRVLLIRDVVDEGIHFYTNYGSSKARAIAKNNKASINIFWPEMDRQIRIKVELSKLDERLSDDYFKTRPRASQIGAWASKQSDELASREKLDEIIESLEKEFEGIEVDRPPFWGGYLAKALHFEFWQGRPNRLHDRVVYYNTKDNWKTKRLFP